MPMPGCNSVGLYDCLLGKCIKVIVSGIYSGDAEGDCATCEEYNTTYYLSPFGPLSPPGDCSSYSAGFVGAVEGLGCTTGLVELGIRKSCGGDTHIVGLLTLHDYSGGFHPGFVTFEFDDYDSASATTKLDQLCNGGSIELPLTYQHADPAPETTAAPCYAHDDAKMTVSLVDGSFCDESSASTYNCVSDVCSPVFDGSGTYATLAACVAASCEPPPATYRCIDGLCSDPLDGTGAYSTLSDCTDSGCAAPTCLDLDGCDSMVLVAETLSLNDCDDGTYNWLLSNLNGTDFMVLVVPSGYIFRINYGDDSTYPTMGGDGARLYKQKSVVAGVHEETFIYRREIIVTCSEGQMTITEDDWYLKKFGWTEPGSPVFITTDIVARNPTSSLPGTATTCKSSFMLSVFTFTDCLGSTVTYSISGTIS